MQSTGGEYHVIVIGTGQAGQEAARTIANNGYTALYVPADPGAVFSMMCRSGHHVGASAQAVQEWCPEQPKDTASYFLQVQTFPTPGEGNGFIIQAYVDKPLLSSRKMLREDHVVQERERFVREKMIRRHGLFLRTNAEPTEHVHASELQAESISQPAPESDPYDTSSQPVYREREVYLRKKMMGYRSFWSEKPADPKPFPEALMDDNRQQATKTAVPLGKSEAERKESLYREEEIWAVSNASDKPLKKTHQHLNRLEESRAEHKVRIFETRSASWSSPSATSESFVWQDNQAQVGSRTTRSKSLEQVSYLDTGKQKKRKPTVKKATLPTKKAKPQTDSPSPPALRETAPPKHPEIPIKPKPKMVSPPVQPKERTSFLQQDAARQVLEQSAPSVLKRDSIDFEDAYGYNSWDDLLAPFSNSSKRQEVHQIEKRKLALRGLHNLINNLG